MSREALQSSVLVLNRSLIPVQLTTAQKAFCLLWKAAAEVVDVSEGQFEFHGFESWQEISELKRRSGIVSDDAEWVSTIRYEIEVPRIIRLLTYDRYPRRSVPLNRRNIMARDENRCQYCGKRFPTTELSIDHVVPLAVGGRTSWTNVVCACTSCNKCKGGRTPAQAGMTLIRAPAEPKHNPQIQLKLRLKKYYTWRHFLNEAYWSVPLK